VAQDAAWREQQRKLLTAQFGPREVAALGAANPATLAAGPAEAGAAAGGPLAWVQARPLTLAPALSLTPSAGRSVVINGVLCCQARALGAWRRAGVVLRVLPGRAAGASRPLLWACVRRRHSLGQAHPQLG